MNANQSHFNPLICTSCTVVMAGCAVIAVACNRLAQAEQPAQERSIIAFASTRDDPEGNPLLTADVYLMNPNGTEQRRLTSNTDGDAFPAISPDGHRIVFDSNRRRSPGEPLNVSDLFVMSIDGSSQLPLVRGSSASWSPDGKYIAFHASASGHGQPIKTDPGAATTDSDIFMLDVAAALAGKTQPRNLTNNPNAVDDDPDWSPDGRSIVHTSHAVTDDPQNSATAEIYVLRVDGAQPPRRLTNNGEKSVDLPGLRTESASCTVAGKAAGISRFA